MTGEANRKMPATEIVLADVLAGLTNAEMADLYGVAVNTVISHMYHYNIKRPKKPSPLPHDDIIISALLRGMGIRDAAEYLSVNYDTLRSYVRRTHLLSRLDSKRLVSPTRDLRETSEKIVIERSIPSYDGGVKPRIMRISLPRLKFLHGEFAA